MDQPTSQAELFQLMHRLGKLRKGDMFDDLSKGEYHLLEALCGGHGCEDGPQERNASDLARGIYMAPSAVSRMLKSLEGKGYVQRRVDPADRRNTLVSPTPQGEAIRMEHRARFKAVLDRVFAGMGEEDLRQLFALLTRFVSLIEKEMKITDEGEPRC